MNICITLADQPFGQSQSCLSQLAQLKRTMARIQTISVHLLNSILEADLANERGVVVVLPAPCPFNIAKLAHALACSLGCKIIHSLCVVKVTAGPAVQDRDRHLQYGTFKDMVASRLQETIVMQQIKEAAATGLDADLIKGVLIGRRQQQSLAKSYLAENDDTVDLQV